MKNSVITVKEHIRLLRYKRAFITLIGAICCLLFLGGMIYKNLDALLYYYHKIVDVPESMMEPEAPEPPKQVAPKESAVEQVVIKTKRDIEEEVLAEYIKGRNGKVPDEIVPIIAQTIFNKSAEYDIPILLLVGVIEHESLFNPFAVGVVVPKKPGEKRLERALGLMQILNPTRTIDPKKLHNIGYNITIGSQELKDHLTTFNNNLEQALQRYSGGATDYYTKVLTAAGRYALYREKHLVYTEYIASVDKIVNVEQWLVNANNYLLD